MPLCGSGRDTRASGLVSSHCHAWPSVPPPRPEGLGGQGSLDLRGDSGESAKWRIPDGVAANVCEQSKSPLSWTLLALQKPSLPSLSCLSPRRTQSLGPWPGAVPRRPELWVPLRPSSAPGCLWGTKAGGERRHWRQPLGEAHGLLHGRAGRGLMGGLLRTELLYWGLCGQGGQSSVLLKAPAGLCPGRLPGPFLLLPGPSDPGSQHCLPCGHSGLTHGHWDREACWATV